MQLCKFLNCTMDWKLYIAKLSSTLVIAVWKLFLVFFFPSWIVFLMQNLGERKQIQWGPVLLPLARGCHQLFFQYWQLILKAKITHYSTIIAQTTLIKWNNLCNVCITLLVILVGVETWKPNSSYTVHSSTTVNVFIHFFQMVSVYQLHKLQNIYLNIREIFTALIFYGKNSLTVLRSSKLYSGQLTIVIIIIIMYGRLSFVT